jgi:tetratricopeptide (TPR) repeat protein
MVTPTPTPDDPARELRSLVGAGRFQEAFDRFQDGGSGLAREPEAALLAATAATRLGRYGAGVSMAEAALAQFRARGDRDGRMRALNLLGVIAFERGNLDEAERTLGEALELARELDDSLMTARASNNLASLAQLGEKPEVALSLYRSALISYQRLGDRRGMAETHHNLGLVFRQVGRLHDALETVEQAVRLADGAADGSLRALTLTGQAELHLGLGEFARARQDVTVAQQLAQSSGDEIGAAEAGRLRALVALAEGDLEVALAEAEAARATAVRHGSALLQGESAAAAARVLRALGRQAEAERLRAEARSLFERLGAVNWLREFDAAWEGTGQDGEK